jgi:glycosyltransferase involved in cell wall biosynthesis
MAVHNGAAYVQEAIASVLAQTYARFEFVIVDDGSTDATADLLRAAVRRDLRVVLLCNPANLGLAASLNAGIAAARGDFIARMDADDLSHPRRLERQVAFMQSHPQVGVCGTWARTIGRAGVMRYPTADTAIRCELLFHAPLAHPSAMLRRSVLAERGLAYDPSVRHAQDYDLWVRCAEHTQFANLPAYLLSYRVHAEQTGQSHRAGQRATRRRVWRTQLLALGIDPTEDDLALHEIAAAVGPLPDRTTLACVEGWLLRLATANRDSRRYPQRAFAALLAEKWLRLCRAAPGGLPANAASAVASPLIQGVDLSAWAVRLWQRARA